MKRNCNGCKAYNRQGSRVGLKPICMLNYPISHTYNKLVGRIESSHPELECPKPMTLDKYVAADKFNPLTQTK